MLLPSVALLFTSSPYPYPYPTPLSSLIIIAVFSLFLSITNTDVIINSINKDLVVKCKLCPDHFSAYHHQGNRVEKWKGEGVDRMEGMGVESEVREWMGWKIRWGENEQGGRVKEGVRE